MKILLSYEFDEFYSLNKALSQHWSESQKIKKQIMNDVKYLTINGMRHNSIADDDKNKYYYNLYIEYHFDNDRIDTDNFAYMRKAVIDGINQTDLITDDSFKYLSVFDHKYIKNDKKRIVVYFTRTRLKVPHAKPQRRMNANKFDNCGIGYPNRKKRRLASFLKNMNYSVNITNGVEVCPPLLLYHNSAR